MANLSPFKKILLSISALGILAAAVGGGTFATFNATTSNPNNTFTTGTLVLSDKVNSGTTCYSSGGAGGSVGALNSNSGCDTIFSLANQAPGAEDHSGHVTIKNEGNLGVDANGLQLWSSACTGANNSGTTQHGTGNLCSASGPNAIEFYVQETASDFTTATSCVYGGGTATTCAYDASHTLGDFATNHSAQGSSVHITPFDASTHSTHYFVFGVKLDSTADNSVQGLSVGNITYTWYVSQP
ncbi:MAG TPA: SipW-dependent-type signal peptide-containing protein [Candidatus Solibacter sp.]|nr:SipW-dependent-type signal peptide-containing protein [Candidatus Solibacter sp.]